ncbi:hypothetical protein [Spiroplasma endosymbiont of Danaus chrysippus]|uniref:hypothetical protein n=1 Tax=Spiroplasma endosymbiont of Danaus chrysippus TaxID=2691041 RepID=UPI0013C8A073|nr:hypothetical protein [Spiroplasma endosymbiont of Danaus chrysippus]CAB1054279.1 P123 [Spiroplasma endosymbiont of Danaus chrysippus]
MIPKINHQLIKTVWKSTGEIEKDFTQNKDLQFRVCPFTIILGAINSTETGYKPPTSIPNDYTSFSKIFTRREAIQAVWDHSYYPIQNKDNPDEAYKQLQIGDVFYGNILSDQLGITYSATPANNAFIQEQAIKNVVINIPNEKKNFNFINNIVSNLYKLYMIPEVNKVINTDKSIKVDRQWYILEVASKTYNNENKKLAYIQCTFSSLNDKLAHSGLAINQYVQLGAPGDPVALPALDENNNIVLDDNYLTPLPVTHCQISFYGSVKPISIALWGRDIDNNPINTKQHKYRQYPSKLLFPWQYQCSTYDPVSFQALPETNYVLTVPGESTMDSYQDWQKVIAPNYDDGATKHYEGHLRTNVEKTKNTNKVDVSNRLVNYWDNNFLNGAEIEDYNYAIAGNPYFQYYNKNNKKFIGNTHYNMNNNKFKQLNTINALHYFIYNPISEIPLTVRETIKINLNTIPIFGSFMNAFVGGLDIGAKLSSNLLIPQFPYINGLISAELYNFYTTLLYSSQSTNPALIPLDVFRNDTPDAIQAVAGTASHMTSFTFNLTDVMNLEIFDINNGNSDGEHNYTTENLGQIFPNKSILLPKDDSTNSLLQSPAFTNTNIVKWAIDMIDIKVVGKSNFKITFYSMPDNRSGAVNDNFSIWAGTYQTVGKASNNSRLIQNTFILANNTFKFDQPFNYPQAIQPPPLIERAQPIFIDLSNQNQYGITNSIISTTPENKSYQMRPSVNEELSGYGRAILFSFKDYGYDSFDKFKEDYESMTFNFNFNMSGSFPLKGTSTTGNKKSWFTPIKINLNDLKDINEKNPQFESNVNYYDNNSGNHNDATNNWTFNINNSINEGKDKQIATLTPNDSISNTYINDLLWTNDLPTTTGIDSLGSVWFKIVAYTSFNKYIVLRYQFISTLTSWSYLGSIFVAKADWNLQTTSLVINPKSST